MNESFPPGIWQSYDIAFRAPRWSESTKVSPARITVVWNGTKVQKDTEVWGSTTLGDPEIPGEPDGRAPAPGPRTPGALPEYLGPAAAVRRQVASTATTPSREPELITSGAEHHFASTLRWTGAARGPIRDYDGYSREYVVEMEGKPPLRGSAATVFRGDGALHNPEDWLVGHSRRAISCRRGALRASGSRAARIRGSGDGDHGLRLTAEGDGVHRGDSPATVPVVARTDVDRARALHEQAHHECFIANSVNFRVTNEPEIVVDTSPATRA